MSTIIQFANDHGLSKQSVYQAIQRYSEELEGHITRQERAQILDDYAKEFLEQHMRLPSVVIDEGVARMYLDENNKLLVKMNEQQDKYIDNIQKAQEENNKLSVKLWDEVNVTRQDILSQIDEKLSHDDTKVINAIGRLEALVEELKSESAKKDQRIAVLESEKEQLNGTIESLRTELKAMTDKYMEEASKSVIQKMFGKK